MASLNAVCVSVRPRCADVALAVAGELQAMAIESVHQTVRNQGPIGQERAPSCLLICVIGPLAIVPTPRHGLRRPLSMIHGAVERNSERTTPHQGWGHAVPIACVERRILTSGRIAAAIGQHVAGWATRCHGRTGRPAGYGVD